MEPRDCWANRGRADDEGARGDNSRAPYDDRFTTTDRFDARQEPRLPRRRGRNEFEDDYPPEPASNVWARLDDRRGNDYENAARDPVPSPAFQPTRRAPRPPGATTDEAPQYTMASDVDRQFMASLRECRTFSNIFKEVRRVHESGDQLGPLPLTQALHVLTKLGVRPRDLPRYHSVVFEQMVTGVLEIVRHQPARCDTRLLAMLANALSKFNSKDGLRALLEAWTRERVAQLDAQGMCNVVWAYGPSGVDCLPLMQMLEDEFLSRPVREHIPLGVANIVLGFALGGCLCPRSTPLWGKVEAFLLDASENMYGYRFRDVAQVACAFGLSKYQAQPGLWELLGDRGTELLATEALAECPALAFIQISKGFACSGARHDRLLTGVVERLLQNERLLSSLSLPELCEFVRALSMLAIRSDRSCSNNRDLAELFLRVHAHFMSHKTLAPATSAQLVQLAGSIAALGAGGAGDVFGLIAPQLLERGLQSEPLPSLGLLAWSFALQGELTEALALAIDAAVTRHVDQGAPPGGLELTPCQTGELFWSVVSSGFEAPCRMVLREALAPVLLQGHLRGYGVRDMARLVRGRAVVGRGPETDVLLAAVEEELLARGNSGPSDPWSLSSLAWAFATMGRGGPRLFSRLESWVLSGEGLTNFPPGELALTLQSFSHIQAALTAAPDRGPGPPPFAPSVLPSQGVSGGYNDPVYCDRMYSDIHGGVGGLSNASVGGIAGAGMPDAGAHGLTINGIGTMNRATCNTRAIGDAVLASAESSFVKWPMRQLRPCHLAATLASFARLRRGRPDLYAKFESEIRQRGAKAFTVEELAVVTWAFASMGHGTRQLFNELAEAMLASVTATTGAGGSGLADKDPWQGRRRWHGQAWDCGSWSEAAPTKKYDPADVMGSVAAADPLFGWLTCLDLLHGGAHWIIRRARDKARAGAGTVTLEEPDTDLSPLRHFDLVCALLGASALHMACESPCSSDDADASSGGAAAGKSSEGVGGGSDRAGTWDSLRALASPAGGLSGASLTTATMDNAMANTLSAPNSGACNSLLEMAAAAAASLAVPGSHPPGAIGGGDSSTSPAANMVTRAGIIGLMRMTAYLLMATSRPQQPIAGGGNCSQGAAGTARFPRPAADDGRHVGSGGLWLSGGMAASHGGTIWGQHGVTASMTGAASKAAASMGTSSAAAQRATGLASILSAAHARLIPLVRSAADRFSGEWNAILDGGTVFGPGVAPAAARDARDPALSSLRAKVAAVIQELGVGQTADEPIVERLVTADFVVQGVEERMVPRPWWMPPEEPSVDAEERLAVELDMGGAERGGQGDGGGDGDDGGRWHVDHDGNDHFYVNREGTGDMNAEAGPPGFVDPDRNGGGEVGGPGHGRQLAPPEVLLKRRLMRCHGWKVITLSPREVEQSEAVGREGLAAVVYNRLLCAGVVDAEVLAGLRGGGGRT